MKVFKKRPVAHLFIGVTTLLFVLSTGVVFAVSANKMCSHPRGAMLHPQDNYWCAQQTNCGGQAGTCSGEGYYPPSDAYCADSEVVGCIAQYTTIPWTMTKKMKTCMYTENCMCVFLTASPSEQKTIYINDCKTVQPPY